MLKTSPLALLSLLSLPLSLLDGSGGLVADDLGVSLMMPLAQCMGNKDIFYNIGNMILLPRAEAALMTEYE